MKPMKKDRNVLTSFVASFSMTSIVILVAACPSPGSGQQPPKNVKDGIVKVADDACHEVVEEGLAPEWVALICDSAAGAIKVLLPRQEWHAMKARRAGVDAGPGK